MKFNLKNTTAGALVMVSLIPSLVFAENGVAKTKDSANNFCSKISTLQSKYADQITKAETKHSKNEMDRSNKIAKKEGDADAKRASGRTDIDSKRMQNWGKMTNKAKTDAEKAAVEAYKASISKAVTDRRSSVDGAIKAYRDGLTSAMTTHSGAIDGAISAFKSSVDAALAKAQADCTSGVTSKTVKDAFNKTVNDARKILQDARKSAEMTSGLTALKKTRDNAIKLAETTFKQATEKARADLLLAFK